MTQRPPGPAILVLDDSTRALVRLSAALAGGTEEQVRRLMRDAALMAPHEWIEELLLQTYLFAGFPRALNGMREWRRHAPQATDATLESVPPGDRRTMGETTCARVYGDMYDRLRVNIRDLHPLLDDWMIEEGYGKVLSRPALDLPRRELCIVAACVASAQDRQLLSHLHGARNVGVPDGTVSVALEALTDLVPAPVMQRARDLWGRIHS